MFHYHAFAFSCKFKLETIKTNTANFRTWLWITKRYNFHGRRCLYESWSMKKKQSKLDIDLTEEHARRTDKMEREACLNRPAPKPAKHWQCSRQALLSGAWCRQKLQWAERAVWWGSYPSIHESQTGSDTAQTDSISFTGDCWVLIPSLFNNADPTA